MFGRRFPRRTAVALALAVLVCGSAHAQEKAKVKQHTWKGVERIVAVGDVHGDYGQFVKTLQYVRVIDKSGKWIGGKTHLVQTGDVLDRGPDSRKVMDLLMKLEKEAAKAGGGVHALVGNHESMILYGDWRYVHPGESQAFGGADKYRAAMGPKGKYGKWIRSHNAVVKINDVLFLHGGLAGRYGTMSLDEINNGIRAGLNAGGGMGRDKGGPLWYRGLAKHGEKDVAKQLEPVFKTHKARHIVIGHCVSDRILPRAGGKVIQIDVGMSKAYGGPAGCLLIEKGVYYGVYAGKGAVKLDVGTEPKKKPQPKSKPKAPAKSKKKAAAE